MNNVVPLRPRQRVWLRYWAYWAAGGANAAVVLYLMLLSFWPEVFLHWLGGLTVALAAVVTNGVALYCYAQKVRQRREGERRRREWRQTQAEFNRKVRAQEAAKLRAAMEAPTQVIPHLKQRPRDPLFDGLGSPLGRLWDELNERTGELSAYERPTPPHGWRSGVA